MIIIKRLLQIMLLLLCVSFATAKDGGSEGVGGDPLAAEFVSQGYNVFARIVKSSSTLLKPSEMRSFQLALASTQIEFVNEEIVDVKAGVVTSVVLPDPKDPTRKIIRINKQSWIAALAGNLSTDRYVFHEYLRVIGVNDNHYEVSNRLDLLDNNGRLGIIEFTETISGALIPFLKNHPSISVYDNNQSRSFCHSTIDANVENEAKSAAINSFTEANLNWVTKRKKEIQAEWRSDLGIVAIDSDPIGISNLGTWSVIESDAEFYVNPALTTKVAVPLLYGHLYPHIDFDAHRHVIGDYLGDVEYCPSEFALRRFARHGVRISFDMTKKITKLANERTTGETFLFRAADAIDGNISMRTSSPKEIVVALNKAEASYQNACSTWKTLMKKKLEENFIWADCGVPTQDRRGIAGNHDRTPATHIRSVRFSSQGTVYITE